MTNKRGQRVLRASLVMGLISMIGLTVSALAEDAGDSGSTFEQQRSAVSTLIVTQSEQTIVSLLDSGMAEHKSTQAAALVEKWLQINVAKDPMLLYKAGRASEISGDWHGAVNLYRQYLKRADLKSEAAADAVLAVYSLQIDYLNDADAAYAFSRTEGDRLVVMPAARQFDAWFLDRAIRQNDYDAVAARLLALVEAKVPAELLQTVYSDDFHWLLDTIDHQRLDSKPFSDQFVANVKKLSSLINFDDEYRLLLDWDVSVFHYNRAILAGDQPDPPIAEATVLLDKYPRYALKVQTDWAGGSRGRYYRGDPKTYWSTDTAAKMKPILAAAGKLSASQYADLIESWGKGYYDGGPDVMNAEQSRAFVLDHAEFFQQHPRLIFSWPQLLDGLTYEQAVKLAPVLENSAASEASYISAMVAGGPDKDLNKIIAALIGPGAWRLSASLCDTYVMNLWMYAGRPEGNKRRDLERDKARAVFAKIPGNEADKNAPESQRLSTFKKLWADLLSPKPQSPSVRWRVMNLLRVTPEALPVLLADDHVVARQFASGALDEGIVGKSKTWEAYAPHASLATDRYSPGIQRMAAHYRGMDRLKQYNGELYKPQPLEPVLRQAVQDRLKAGQVEPWLVMAWLNAQFPEDNAACVDLITQLYGTDGWKQSPYELRWGARKWFGPMLMGQQERDILAAADPKVTFKELLTLPKTADAATVAQVFARTIDSYRRSPIRVEFQGLDRLAEVNVSALKDPKVIEQLITLLGDLRVMDDSYPFGGRLAGIVDVRSPPRLINAAAGYLWKFGLIHRRSGPLIDLAGSLIGKNPSSASALARIGMLTLSECRNARIDAGDLARLKSIRGKAAMAMGLMDIPVAANDPAYPIYKSQAEFAVGNEQGARALYQAHADRLMPIYRNLSVSYMLWLLQESIDNRNEQQQEMLARALRAWVKDMPSAFTIEQRIKLDIAFGDIAVQKGMLPEAEKIFAAIQHNADYKANLLRFNATLRRASVQRIAHEYDAAMQTLAELEAEKIPSLTTAARLARAEVYYDMQQYDDAGNEVAKVLDSDPESPDALILRGKVQLKQQQLIEATEIEVGDPNSKTTLVPGEQLKVTLNDPTLEMSGGGSSIEVAAWTTSGDKEYLLLRQFGDQKTKYRGEINTALGKPAVNDGTLQVIGDDKVYYDFSERFRQKVGNLKEHQGGPITIASNAALMASARKLLSANEQRVADLNAAAEAEGLTAPAALSRMTAEEVEQFQAEASASRHRLLMQSQVKPGNPIHLRVIDPDRSRTAGIDELSVSVSSSNGDQVNPVVLKETGDYTGHFEGALATAPAQAMAYGSTTEAGRDANMVISPRTDYPAWRPVPSSDNQPIFTVDLNDNAALGQLGIAASDPGFPLEKFIIQTAMNRQNWTTVAAYPNSGMLVNDQWRPSIMVVGDTDEFQMSGRDSFRDFKAIAQQAEIGWLAQHHAQGMAENVSGPSQAMPESVVKAVDWKRQGRFENTHVIYHFQAYFYEPYEITRRFRLNLGKFEFPNRTPAQQQTPAKFLLAIDGQPITKADGDLDGERQLKPGLHKFEIWGIGWVKTSMGFGRRTTLQTNPNGDEVMQDCPDSFFDPAQFPAGVLEHRNAPAAVTVGDDGKRFEVKFAPDSKARLLRIVFGQGQVTVPSLNHLTLTTPDGRKLLPAPHDYAELRKNEVLEILPGDKITVRYIDDRLVTRSMQKLERTLNAAYTDGRIEFADIDPRPDRNGNPKPYHERLIRFQFGQPLPIVIHDADRDVSTRPDQVTCTVQTGAGEQRQLTATETGDSIGIFRVIITPVRGPATKPDEIQIGDGGNLQVSYRDQQNLDPGIPSDRVASIDQATFAQPRFQISDMTVTPVQTVDRTKVQTLNERFDQEGDGTKTVREQAVEERIATYYKIEQRMADPNSKKDGSVEVVDGRYARIEVIAPQLALRQASHVEIFTQTDSGRAMQPAAEAKDKPAPAFDIHVPGTMKWSAYLKPPPPRRLVPERGGYAVYDMDHGPVNDPDRLARDGRFVLEIPLIPGVMERQSYADIDEDKSSDIVPPNGLIVKAGEKIHLGFRYTDAQGREQWLTASAKVITRPMLDVMEEDYRSPLTAAYIGERMFIRVVDMAADKSDDRDSVEVLLTSRSGGKQAFKLQETGIHTGVFKGPCELTYTRGDATGKSDDAQRFSFAVSYGDQIAVQYTDSAGHSTPVQTVDIKMGADGMIVPFSKVYNDQKMASQTLFALADSYLELVRRRQALKQEDAANREFATAKQLLANSINQLEDRESQAHAQYLLGIMAIEDADATPAGTDRNDRYRAALARLMKVTDVYADTPYAADAQFKIAVVYERMAEPDIAAQEYVKLAYKYPESQHLATAMARLGTHFQRKAVDYDNQAKLLLAKTGDTDALNDGKALEKMSQLEYIKAAQIFERLQTRFPDDELAGKAGLQAGKIYFHAEDYRSALKVLDSVINNKNYDGPTLRSEAMFWAGRSCESLKDMLRAYSLYKQLTYDFPETEWAAYARGQLSSDHLQNLERNIEMKRLQDAP